MCRCRGSLPDQQPWRRLARFESALALLGCSGRMSACPGCRMVSLSTWTRMVSNVGPRTVPTSWLRVSPHCATPVSPVAGFATHHCKASANLSGAACRVRVSVTANAARVAASSRSSTSLRVLGVAEVHRRGQRASSHQTDRVVGPQRLRRCLEAGQPAQDTTFRSVSTPRHAGGAHASPGPETPRDAAFLARSGQHTAFILTVVRREPEGLMSLG